MRRVAATVRTLGVLACSRGLPFGLSLGATFRRHDLTRRALHLRVEAHVVGEDRPCDLLRAFLDGDDGHRERLVQLGELLRRHPVQLGVEVAVRSVRVARVHRLQQLRGLQLLLRHVAEQDRLQDRTTARAHRCSRARTSASRRAISASRRGPRIIDRTCALLFGVIPNSAKYRSICPDSLRR